MIDRYTRPEMGAIWSEENKYRAWLEVELATAEALAVTNEVPAEAAQLLRKHAGFTAARIREIERDVRHDVIAFTTAVSESMAAAGHGEASRWLHYGLTSNDVVDTAQALQIRSASEIITKGINKLADSLKTRAFEFKHTVQIGRTHGVHAEPITFGLKLAIWYDEIQRNLGRFAAPPKRCASGRFRAPWGHSVTSDRKRKNGLWSAWDCARLLSPRR
jgi:adenylosuccinate lyase